MQCVVPPSRPLLFAWVTDSSRALQRRHALQHPQSGRQRRTPERAHVLQPCVALSPFLAPLVFALSCLPTFLVLTQGPLADDDMLMHAELDLPSGYESYEQFRQKLLLAITEVRSSLLTLPRLLTLPCSLFRSSTSFSFSY